MAAARQSAHICRLGGEYSPCEEKKCLARLPVTYRRANVPHRQCIGSMLVNEYLNTAVSTQ